MKKLCLAGLILLALILPVWGEESAPREISTPEELYSIGENPSGSYILTEDLDMEGREWIPLDFSGSLDGNGHSILNLTLSQTGGETGEVLDGNFKPYQAVFAGLFSKLENAEVKNLGLINLRALVVTEESCFVAAVAGYSDHSTVSGCTITATLELRAHEGMFGVAGVLGYGTGCVEGCNVDVSLICVDTAKEVRDEQFLGGIYGTGFLTARNNTLNMKGYISEHGYVHSGAVAGMFLQYPIGKEEYAEIVDNTVNGHIRFFEDNTDRRAYCGKTVGELVKAFNWNYSIVRNATTFLRDEVFTYDTELRPETCEAPVYTETVVPSGCDTFGYTEYTCTGCGYTYRDHYTLHTHSVSRWTETVSATTREEGLSTGNCDLCGVEQTRVDPTLPMPETTLPPETQPEVAEVEEVPETPAASHAPVFWALGTAAVLVLLGAVLLLRKRK